MSRPGSAAALLAVLLAAVGAPAAAIERLLVYDCASSVGRREVVLFDDGMVRFKEGPPGREKMELVGLDPDRLTGFLARLRREDKPGWGDPSTDGPGGSWVERCRLQLSLPGEPLRVYSFRRYDALSLALSRLRALAEEITETTRGVEREGLPRDYQPRAGDVLERRDGVHFRLLRQTGDRGGFALQGIDQPLLVYVPKDSLHREFVRVVSRRRP